MLQLELGKMGHLLCFGRKKERKLEREEEEGEREHAENASISNLSPVRGNIRLDMKLEATVSRAVTIAKSTARTFAYRELATATKNFRQESLIGQGGFGPVYKGKIGSTGQVVAVKQLNQTGLQGEKEFLVEVLMFSLLCHPNLVNMIGYCAEGDQRLLVYEFMPLGSLEYHLHCLTPDMEPLDWKTRMRIAVGAAKGLDYLHNQANPPVIYRDLKSSNILLGEGYHPKLSDFGLAKFGPSEDKSHVSTRVMGTHGYCAPDYAFTGKLSTKSDIYSFGILLLELITGQRALDPNRRHGKQVLVEWVRPLLRDRKKHVQLADPRLEGQFLESVFCKVLEVALMCVQEDSHSRPCMHDVVLALDYLISEQGDHNASHGSHAENERARRILNNEGEKHEKMVAQKGSEGILEESIMLNKDQEREQAVAEAKMWGETWRAKRQQSGMEHDFSD